MQGVAFKKIKGLAGNFTSVKDVLTALDEHYAEHDEAMTYRNRFFNLAMTGSQSLSDFLSEFQECQPYMGFGTETTIDYLTRKVSAKYKDKLAGKDFSTLRDLYTFLKRLEIDFEKNKPSIGSRDNRTMNKDRKDTTKD